MSSNARYSVLGEDNYRPPTTHTTCPTTRYIAVLQTLQLLMNVIFLTAIVTVGFKGYHLLTSFGGNSSTSSNVSLPPTFVTQLQSIYTIITEATRAVPYVNQVWNQYQSCSPLLQTIC